MKKTALQKRNRRLVQFTAVIALIAAWVSIPMLTGGVKADATPVIVLRNAALVSPTGSINPHGAAAWQLYQSGNREIEVEIEDVSLSMGTALSAVVDGNVIGTMTVDDRQKAKLKLRTEDGQAVPMTNDGSTVEVRNGTTVLVAGALNGGGPNPTPTPTGTPNGTPSPSPTGTPTGTPSPSPSPTGSPNSGDLFAGLTGGTINGVLPRGYAQYEIHSSRTELEIRLNQINLPAGTSLSVTVDGTSVGNMSLQSGGEGRLRLRSDNGQTVPVVIAGSTISIANGGSAILNGNFAGFSGPTPSPTPTGTPGPTPSPSPSMGRSFEANLTGSGMTPPVTTAATGEFKVTLNAAETQATVFGEFHNLSSAQTAARIETLVGTTMVIKDFGTVGGTNGNFASVTFDVTPAQVQLLRTGLWMAVISSANNPGGEIASSFRQRSGLADFDGDGSNDFSVFRPATGAWYTQNSAGFGATTFGTANDTVVSGDYDGDGKTDTAVYRNVNGQGVWEIKSSFDGSVRGAAFGLGNDTPVRGDFDGDGRLDLAVYRPSNGVWYIQKSNNTGYSFVTWGIAEDKPMPADIDGDGMDDVVVYRPSLGNWYWVRSSDGQTGAMHFGAAGDIPVRGDFDGDGKGDVTVFRPSTGVWYTYRSTDGGYTVMQFGLDGDIPVAGNYDNDGKTDIAVFRPADGNWYILRSSDGAFQAIHFGLNGDLPVAAQ